MQLKVGELEGQKVSNRIPVLWYVQVGLCPPHIPKQQLAELYRDIGYRHKQLIGLSSIDRRRDAWAEMLKSMNREHTRLSILAAPCQSDGPVPVFFNATQDEAAMALKTFLPNAVGKLVRGTTL